MACFEQRAVDIEQSYERDSRWKPHLSWSYLSWKLQQRMEEQANQRELAWQRIADKLGPLIISTDGGLTFGRGIDYASPEDAQERASERTPFYKQKLSYSNINYQPIVSSNSNNNNNDYNKPITPPPTYTPPNNDHSSNATTSKLQLTTVTTTNSSSSAHRKNKTSQQDKAKRRCMTVSGILIALIILLFTLVILMALGILHR